MSEYQIAEGHDNAAGLTALEALEPPLFAAYADGVLSEWHDSEGQAWAGDRRVVPIGRAWAAWRFFRLTADELAYLRENFGAGVGSRSAPVTIRTLDKGAGAFANFNATLVLPDLVKDARWDAGGWNEVRVELRDLAEIEG
jgi:hypothetical protein